MINSTIILMASSKDGPCAWPLQSPIRGYSLIAAESFEMLTSSWLSRSFVDAPFIWNWLSALGRRLIVG